MRKILNINANASTTTTVLGSLSYDVGCTPYAAPYASIYRYGTTCTPIKDIQREHGTSLEHIMVGTEYGMAPEMTHGPAAGLRVLH